MAEPRPKGRTHRYQTWWYKTLRILFGFKRMQRLDHWWTAHYRKTFTLVIADNEEMFYVEQLAHRFSSWLGVATYTDFPPPEHDPKRYVHKDWGGGCSFDNDTYWRATLPFTFWKVRRKRQLEEQVPFTDQRVQDYIAMEKQNAR